MGDGELALQLGPLLVGPRVPIHFGIGSWC